MGRISSLEKGIIEEENSIKIIVSDKNLIEEYGGKYPVRNLLRSRLEDLQNDLSAPQQFLEKSKEPDKYLQDKIWDNLGDYFKI